MTALMSVEGVLRNALGEPIQEGFKLFRTLVVSYRVVLSSTMNAQELEHFVKRNYLFDYGNLLSSEDFYEGQPLRMRHLDLSRQEGKLELFIDADPDMCAQALAQSVPSILFTTPKYFQAHRHIKPWGVITEEQQRQKELVAEKYIQYINGEGKRWE